MKTLDFAFLGGCINNQPGILPTKLYHQQLKEKLEKSDAVKVTTIVGSYLSYNSMYNRAVRLLRNNEVDVLVVYLRPFTLMPLIKPFVKYEQADGSKKMALHPAIFNRKSLSWPEKFTLFQSGNEYIFTNRKRFELRDANLICGLALGLNKWSKRLIENEIIAVRKLCSTLQVKLILVSPSKNPESLVGNYVCKATARHFKNYCFEKGIDYVDFSQLSNAYFEKDGVHINELAHTELCNLLYNKLLTDKHLICAENIQLTA